LDPARATAFKFRPFSPYGKQDPFRLSTRIGLRFYEGNSQDAWVLHDANPPNCCAAALATGRFTADWSLWRFVAVAERFDIVYPESMHHEALAARYLCVCDLWQRQDVVELIVGAQLSAKNHEDGQGCPSICGGALFESHDFKRYMSARIRPVVDKSLELCLHLSKPTDNVTTNASITSRTTSTLVYTRHE
jgi:hypothetical protein